MRGRLPSLFLLLIAAPAMAQQPPPQLPPATPREIQLRTQLGEALWELGVTQAQLAAMTKERDVLKAAAKSEETEKK
jgi:hypothetical protein